MTDPEAESVVAREDPFQWEALARAAAQTSDENDDPLRGVQQLLAFELSGSPYAIRVECIREIVRIRPIASIPRVSGDVRGVISLRGEILQVIDLRRRIGMEPIEPDRRSRIIVVQAEDGSTAGLLVDGVREVLRVQSETIRPNASSEAGFVESICVRGEQFVSLINLQRVLEIDVDS